jgi:hypothetical protein
VQPPIEVSQRVTAVSEYVDVNCVRIYRHWMACVEYSLLI